jgi:Flp pilus assembly protein TadB
MSAMAQTKRKRRSKHRGNAAGSIEARGRTGRKPTSDEMKKSSRQQARDRRLAKPPSWNSAAVKALAMAALLFALTQFGILGKNTSIGQGLLLAAFALILYTPLAYMTDKWVYNRMLRQREKKGPPA